MLDFFAFCADAVFCTAGLVVVGVDVVAAGTATAVANAPFVRSGVSTT